MQRITVEQDFPHPVEKVFAYFGEHENLQALFGIRVERLNDGTDGTRNGVGSARKLSIFGALPFVETVTESVPNELIAYKITKGSPLRNHHGEMKFVSTGANATHMIYTISFGAVLPGLDKIIALGLGSSLRRGLPKAKI